MKSKILLFLKGMAMGAADVVPGVSGGTIAFISGIYEELLASIQSVGIDAVKILFKEGPKAFWKHINGGFLATLLSGILVSVASLAKLIGYLLKNEAVLIWSFFFGLIIASAYLVHKQVTRWDAKTILSFVIGVGVSYYVTIASPTHASSSLLYVFLSGAVAICAMILPGISGSFILLLMGSYSIVLGSITDLVEALKVMNISVITEKGILLSVFASGCVVGILSFSHLLNWMFKNAHNLTVALLTGFMLGSLNKVWPWKEVIEYRVNSHGEKVPFLESNILPQTYETINQVDSQIVFALILAVGGFLLVFGLEKLGDKLKENKA